MPRDTRSNYVLAISLLTFTALSTANIPRAHAQWYVQAGKAIAAGVSGSVSVALVLWGVTNMACNSYEGRTNNPSGRILGACRKAGANKNDLQAQIKVLRLVPKEQSDEALQSFCDSISESEKRVVLSELSGREKEICAGKKA